MHRPTPLPTPAPRATRRTTTPRGLTLVELLIVIVIIGITATLVVPMMASAQSAQLTAAAEMLVGDLAFVRADSMSHGADLRAIVFDPDGQWYRVAAQSDPDTPLTHPIDKQPYETHFGAGRAVTLSSVQIDSLAVGDDNILGFEQRGELDQPTDATITLRVGAGTVTITLDAISGEATVGQVQSD